MPFVVNAVDNYMAISPFKFIRTSEALSDCYSERSKDCPAKLSQIRETAIRNLSIKPNSPFSSYIAPATD